MCGTSRDIRFSRMTGLSGKRNLPGCTPPRDDLEPAPPTPEDTPDVADRARRGVRADRVAGHLQHVPARRHPGLRRRRKPLVEGPHDRRRATAGPRRHGFLAGGNDEADITSMMVLYHLFSDTWLFQTSLRAWIQGDHLIAELRLLAERSQRLTPEQRDGPAGLALSREIAQVDRQLLAEERVFLAHLTRAAHATEWLLHVLVLTSVT